MGIRITARDTPSVNPGFAYDVFDGVVQAFHCRIIPTKRWTIRRNAKTKPIFTSDQIPLFDLLFQFRCLEHQLGREQYAIHMNVNYSHLLEDDALRDTLIALEHRGDVAKYPLGCGEAWVLTPAGGRKWELERIPDFQLFALRPFVIRANTPFMPLSPFVNR
ncbi:MAG: hypothetical protein AAFP69_21525 [Planctomycetota bacterium]